MAKLSSQLRNEKRKQLVAKYPEQRRILKAVVKNQAASPDEKQEAQSWLNALPRNASPVRVRNRCGVSGRVRGYLRRFGMSRIDFRLLALKGGIPGVRKSSWRPWVVSVGSSPDVLTEKGRGYARNCGAGLYRM